MPINDGQFLDISATHVDAWVANEDSFFTRDAQCEDTHVNADHGKRVVLNLLELPWIGFPAQSVNRVLIERNGWEVARTTSLLHFAPGAAIKPHVHALGEEVYVLRGVFEDEHGIYPEGTYIRNPAGSQHRPFSETGCSLFVKHGHLDPNDSVRVVVNAHDSEWLPGLVPGLSVLPLCAYGRAHASLVRWAPGTAFAQHRHFGGEEILVLEGLFEDEHGTYPEGTWMRSPHLSQHTPYSRHGATILVKTGHLDIPRR